MSMKILHVINNLQRAGAERLVRDLSVELQRQGCEVSVFLLNANGGFEADVRAAGIPVYTSGPLAVRSPLHALKLARHLRSHSYDAIHAHLFPTQLWTAMARRLAGCGARFVTTEHSITTRRRNALGRPLDWCMSGQYDAICCVSEGVAASFTSWLPQYRERVRVIPNGIDLSRSGAPVNRRSGESLALVSVGRCEVVKRHDVTLRALTEIPAATLRIIGDGPCRPELSQLAAELGVAGRVQFLGQRADVDALLRESDVFVHSSANESFGMAPLEAMSIGLPVVCSDVPGLREVVGGAALRFRAGDSVQLAELIRSLGARPELWQNVSAAVRRRALGFSIANTARAHLSVYQCDSKGVAA